MRHHAQFHQNRRGSCGDIAFFPIFKMAADFQNFKLLVACGVGRPACIIIPNFIKIGEMVKKISYLAFFFSKMAAIRHLGFVWAHFNTVHILIFTLCKIRWE